MDPSVYIETSVISYLTSLPSRDLVIAGHQQSTYLWWNEARAKFSCYISPFVVDECKRGDEQAAQKRLSALSGITLLNLNLDIEALAEIYFKAIQIPEKARADAFHLAIATHYKMQFLVSWNCVHMVSGRVRKILEAENTKLKLMTPTICTPEELMEV